MLKLATSLIIHNFKPLYNLMSELYNNACLVKLSTTESKETIKNQIHIFMDHLSYGHFNIGAYVL